MIEPLRILIVDDSAEDRSTYKRLLMRNNENDFVFSEVDSGSAALSNCKNHKPDCILLDYNLPELDGLEFLNELTEDAMSDRPAVVMLTGVGSEAVAVKAMQNGAQDYLVKDGITSETLQRAINNAIEKAELKHLLKMREDELKRRTLTDDLTGLYSRRYTLEHLQEEIYRADRYSIPFCVVMIDLDHFKQINDNHGHLSGDRVLMSFSKLLRKCTRQLDIVGRYGGDEFLVILPSTTLDVAQVVTQRIRTNTQKLTFHGSNEQAFQLTASIGLTEYVNSIDDNVKTLVERADQAMYRAKQAGRNLVCTSQCAEESTDRILNVC